jgi:GNAT superfamily N-acetyltransferase
MWWRLARREFETNKGEGNRQALKRIVESGEEPGLLAYMDDLPVGWVSVAPRQTFTSLELSRVLSRVDDQPVWSIVCFFIRKGYRRQGLSNVLIQAAVDYAKQKGARIVEGYPVPKKDKDIADPFVWTGIESAFEKAGFKCVVRRGKSGRGIWRKTL